MSKKTIITLIIVGIFVITGNGIVSSLHVARAGFFDDFLRLFKNEIPQSTSSDTLLNKDVWLKEKRTEKIEEKEIPLYKPAVDYEDAVVAAVEKSSPSVISIVVSKDVPIIERCPYNPFGNLPPEFQDLFGGGFGGGIQFDQPCEKGGTKKQDIGGGSGFVISDDGLILTNKHVVSDTKADYTIFTNTGKKYDAKVVARDPVSDLAVLRVTGAKLPAAKLGNSESVKLGQTAIAIGNALGEFKNTVSVGVISGLARNVTASGPGVGTETIQGVIQTDAAINPGNSGGPLLNLRGEVIGINTAIAQGAQNIGFAIPINQAKRAINSVKKTGSIKVPYLGVRYINLNEEIAKKQKLSVEEGALVRGTEDGPAVIPSGPAAKAGIQAEDIIMEVMGEKITFENPLMNLIQKYSIGDMVTLKVRRDGKIIEVQVKLEERPES